MQTLPPRDEMESAFRGRDQTYDGVFWLGVRTTGMFCRPSCPARKPLGRNVEYFATVREAMFAGYRPCKRCRPLKTGEPMPAWAATLTDRLEAEPDTRITDGTLGTMGIEPARARRFFLRRYGMTFQAFARGRRLGRAFARLREGADLDAVALDHGYESHSGFRDAFAQLFGAPPGQSREAGHVTLGWMESPLGPLVAGATDRGVCLLEFSDRRMLETQVTTLRRRLKCAAVPGEHPLLTQLGAELEEYFGARRRGFTVPLHYPGTEFQVRVWTALRDIPYGQTTSYEALAATVSRPGAQRAVGKANGDNRIAIVIPCHRVVRKDGTLCGYGGGLWRKRRLLELERGVTTLALDDAS
ncbi:MAG TPA: methylated-DNA--[protein]-cysteine S-methyltransferase [Gemmatimonadales bacterium]|nr:methylated-DNA--[protein]-cysteine S-methyltransferase [Gemmatimonadales bacterium]